MRKTYAYNSIIIGVLLAILVYASTENIFLGILTLVGVSVVGFILIRFLEKAISKGVDTAVDAASSAIKKRKEQKDQQQDL